MKAKIKKFFQILASTCFVIAFGYGIIFLISKYNDKHKVTAETPTVEEIQNIHDHTVYEKSLVTGLCHEVVKLQGEDGKTVLYYQWIDCDKLKNIKVTEVP